MNIAVACVVFLVILLVYAVIAEVFTVLFRLTGMPERKARFQVMSLLTNSGYTTAESESVVRDVRRRDLAQKTMLFGYAFSVSIVSAIVNIVFSLKLSEIEGWLWSLPLPVILAGGYFLLRRKGRCRVWLSGQIEKLATYILTRSREDQVLVMDAYGRSVMAQVHLATLPAELRNVRLRETNLREKGVIVMLIKRRGEEAIMADGDTLLRDGDVVVVFGHTEDIEKAFSLERGLAGSQRET